MTSFNQWYCIISTFHSDMQRSYSYNLLMSLAPWFGIFKRNRENIVTDFLLNVGCPFWNDELDCCIFYMFDIRTNNFKLRVQHSTTEPLNEKSAKASLLILYINLATLCRIKCYVIGKKATKVLTWNKLKKLLLLSPGTRTDSQVIAPVHPFKRFLTFFYLSAVARRRFLEPQSRFLIGVYLQGDPIHITIYCESCHTVLARISTRRISQWRNDSSSRRHFINLSQKRKIRVGNLYFTLDIGCLLDNNLSCWTATTTYIP